MVVVNSNSTSTALTSGQTYTGTWFNTDHHTNYETLIVTVKTDYAGVLYVDFSPDGTNSDRSLTFDVGAAIKHTSPVVIYLFKNATLTGSPNFSQHASTSCSYVDYSATACSISSNNQLIWSGPLGDTGNIEWSFEDQDIRIAPGETITVAARSVTGSPSYVTATLNTKEFQ